MNHGGTTAASRRSRRARRSFRRLAALVASLVAGLVSTTSCGPRVDTTWHQEAGYRWRNLQLPWRGHDGFTQLDASQTGLTHRNDVDDEHALANRNLLIGSGVALGDIDGDGLPDVFLASVEKPAALYRNLGGFKFEDVTAASGIDTKGLATTGAAFADVNGDGFVDLIVGTLGGPLKLWINDGKGHFTDFTKASGLDSGYAATTLTLADVDGNGTLDLYVATYKTRNALDTYPPQARAFDQVVRKVGEHYEVLPEWKKEYRIEERADLGGIVRSQRADPDLFFLNDGKGHFTRVPINAPRFTDENGKPLAEEPDFFGLAARFYDVNGDGAPDLYVCNDFEDPDQFWINDGKGNFRLAAPLAVRETSNTCMSVEFADVNRDGHVDFFTADMESPKFSTRQMEVPTHTPLRKPVGLTPDRPQWMRNMLQVGRGDGTWAQMADYAGITGTDWTWGSAFLDVDLDGYEDLVLVNGHRWDTRDADSYDRIRDKFPRVPWNREAGEFPRGDSHSIALRNNGDLTFRDASKDWGWGKDAAITQGIALADLDGDGALDVVASRLDGPPAVYRNMSGRARVAVRLKGEAPNVAGIGAKITVRAPSLPVQTREITAGGYYLSGSDAELSFAAGSDSIVTIEVRWRDGRVSTVSGARANRLYEIDASRAVAAPAAAPDAKPLFENATALLGGQSHVDSLFDDFRRQPLLPNRLSQLGPGLAWADVDGDGRMDLIVGTGRGGSLTVLRNDGAKFTPMRAAGTARWDLGTVLPVPDGHGGTMLVAAQSNYESASPADAMSAPSVIAYPLKGAAPGAPFTIAPPDSASVGTLALADVNGDGLLDLFVGARVIPGAWPLPAASRLWLRTSDGGWAPDEKNNTVLAHLGLVTAASFVDLDGDGRPDLVVASEWGPIRILHNVNGLFVDETKRWGLAGISSRWNGVSVGDFDGDGRLDLVVTSWGRNIPWHATPERPYELFVGHWGSAGPGLLTARRDSATGREMPVETFARLGVAFPDVRQRVATYADYAKATVTDVLGEAAKSAVRVGATTFDHLLLLNRGDHFDVRPLPPLAQAAPSSGAVVADFDGDGHEDLFLAQNFFPTEISTLRFDAGAGLLLLGDGKGGFTPQPVLRSGIAVLGDQRGAAAADFDGDGRVDLAVSQNGAATTLWHNRGAKVGVRVHLDGMCGAGNPLCIGARVRVVQAGHAFAVREVHAGSGYWSMDAPVPVLAVPDGAYTIEVVLPGGAKVSVPVAAGTADVRVKAYAAGATTGSR